MKHRTLGRNGPMVSALGLGCMGMSEFYGAPNEKDAINTLHHALECGVTMLDTADAYGFGENEALIGRAIKGKRDRAFLATKFGLVRDRTNPSVRSFDGRPAYVRSACEASLRRLGVDAIDLYYLHRVDPRVPIAETVGAMATLVRTGKVRYLGLSEVSSATLHQAQDVHPISAVQSEYSLWTRDPEGDVLPTCRELGISFVAYSPLGRGFLTGRIKRFEDFEPGDYRRESPRFQGANFKRNLRLVSRVQALAAAKGCSPSQLALAWVLAQGTDIVPIPGTKHRDFLDENLGALKVSLSPSELSHIDAAFPLGAAVGARYPEAMMTSLER